MKHLIRLLALALCAALLFGALAEEAGEDVISQAVDAAAGELGEVSLGDAGVGDAGEVVYGDETEFEVEALRDPLDATSEMEEATGLEIEFEPVPDDGAAVFAPQEEWDDSDYDSWFVDPTKGSAGPNASWTLDADGTLTITGTGPVTKSTWAQDSTFRSIRKVVVGEGITALCDSAFQGHLNVTEVILPKTLEEIGASAFSRTNLGEFTVPENVKRIGKRAFYSCGLRKLDFEKPEAVEELDPTFCEGNTGIESLTVPGAAGEIPEKAFANSYQALKEIRLCEGIGTIGANAFDCCQALTAVTLPNSLKTVGDRAFQGCTGLTEVNLGEGVETIGNNAFVHTTGLTAITIPGSVKTIGESAFDGSALETVTLNDGLESIGAKAFQRTRLTDVLVPGSVKTLGAHVFPSTVTRLELAEGLERLEDGALDTLQLTSLVIPASVQFVGKYALPRVEKVQFLGAPYITDDAIWSCKEVHFEGGVPTFSENVFSGTSKDRPTIALYPGDDPAWTPEVRQSYGGFVIWIDSTKRPSPQDGGRSASEPLTEGFRYSTIKLLDNGDGTYTVITSDQGRICVLIRDALDNILWKKTLDYELPIWGNLYIGEEFNFMIFGQANPEEDDNKEVIRVVRYTKNWNRVDDARVFGQDTTVPFDAGSCDAVQSGDMLYIHTAHEMYKSSDGLNHQSNFFVDIHIPTMTVTTLTGFGRAYVSHSFQQFIRRDGSDILQLDLGDAFPRAVVMNRFPGAAGSLQKTASDSQALIILPIAGSFGNNHTGVRLAGLEAGNGCYIVAGTSENQSGENPAKPDNVFVATVSKENYTASGVSVRWLTGYTAESGVTMYQPSLVRLNDDAMILTWYQTGPTGFAATWMCVSLDGQGNATSPILAVGGETSMLDQLAVIGGRPVWVYQNHEMRDLADVLVDPATLAVAPAGTPAGTADPVAEAIPEKTVRRTGSNGSVTVNVGESLRLVPRFAEKKGWTVKKWKSSKKSVAAVDGDGVVTAKKAGKATVTITTKNKKKATITIKVVDPKAPKKVKLDRKSATLKKGETLQLVATLSPSGAESRLSWKSGNRKVAAVDENGLVTAKKKGTAVITVKTANGKKAKIKVKVK